MKYIIFLMLLAGSVQAGEMDKWNLTLSLDYMTHGQPLENERTKFQRKEGMVLIGVGRKFDYSPAWAGRPELDVHCTHRSALGNGEKEEGFNLCGIASEWNLGKVFGR